MTDLADKIAERMAEVAYAEWGQGPDTIKQATAALLYAGLREMVEDMKVFWRHMDPMDASTEDAARWAKYSDPDDPGCFTLAALRGEKP